MKNLLNSVVAEVQLRYVNPVPASQRQLINKSQAAVDLLKLIWEDDVDHC